MPERHRADLPKPVGQVAAWLATAVALCMVSAFVASSNTPTTAVFGYLGLFLGAAAALTFSMMLLARLRDQLVARRERA